MSAAEPVLAVIPARGGSKGLPGKNIRPFAGLPLIAHSILLAKMCPEIDRCVVSTDSEEIAQVARRFEAEVPFLRPGELARDGTPMWPVLRHALEAVETAVGQFPVETMTVMRRTAEAAAALLQARLDHDQPSEARPAALSPTAVGA